MTHVTGRGAWRGAGACMSLLLAVAASAQPINNDCANATAIGNITVVGSTSGATNDFSTGICGASGGSPDVWYLYTAPSTATVNVTTCGGATWDTVLSVHTAPCANRAILVCLDDSCGLQTQTSFSAVAGTQYLIRVSGFSGSSGDFTLVVGPGAGGVPPANDNCANAQAIGNGSVAGTSANATPGGDSTCLSASAADVYYRYTAPATGTAIASTCAAASFDTAISIHSACPATQANQIACNDNFCTTRSQISFSTVAGQQYIVRVGGNATTGTFTLTMDAPPANDTCATATAIGNTTVTGTTANSSGDGASTCSGAASPDVYYLYTAPTTRTVTASTCVAASFDTSISIHSGCPATTANQIACNDNFCGTRAQVNFSAVAGQQYFVRLSGPTTGTYTLSLGDAPPPGPNGPDVVHRGMTSGAVFNAGAVGGIRGYALGSETCNNGDANLLWTSFGTPGLGMNAYRLHNGRLLQIGMGHSKTACCAAAGGGCTGTCNGAGGSVLGAGCLDVYGAGYNAGQSHLAPRSAINAYTGVISSYNTGGGDAIFKRLQVTQADMNTTTYPGALFFVEGAYIATDDAAAGNGLNNNTHLRVTVNQSSFDMTGVGSAVQMIPAIRAWRDNGLGAGVPDPSVNVFTVDVPSEGRYWVATKVRDLGNGRWLYDYAIYNLNSDRSGGSLSIPRGAGVSISGIGFNDVPYHSGDPYDNTDWTNGVSPTAVVWSSPQTFAQNANSNALRWGTMYNYWFEANTPPTTGQATLTLFKPGTPNAVSFDVPVPTNGCTGDWNDDGSVTSQDFFDFMAAFFNNNADFNNNGTTDSQDFFDFIAAFFQPC